jgi:hypothetical protein
MSLEINNADAELMRHAQAHNFKYGVEELVPYTNPAGETFYPLRHANRGPLDIRPEPKPGDCGGCAARGRAKVSSCHHLPACGAVIWAPDSPEARAAFVAQRMTA